MITNGETIVVHRRGGLFGLGALIAALALFTSPAPAGEQPAGEPIEVHGLQIMAVYLQPVVMEPAMPSQEAAGSDIHLEADIHATADNDRFAEDDWIPGLKVTYTLTKKGSAWKATGTLHPMIASDGPHYGANLALDGPGAYDLLFHVEPPSATGFMRHTDKETGVAAWWAPFDYAGAFKFVGTGKKGTY